MSSMLRSYARGVAYNNMKKKGIVGINDNNDHHGGRYDSYFSKHWREFTNYKKGDK